MSTVFEKLQRSTEELQAACRKMGLKVNFSKRKIITSSEKRITLEDEVMETVWEFLCFFGYRLHRAEREREREGEGEGEGEGKRVRVSPRKPLEVFQMHCLRAIRGVTRADRLQHIKNKEDTFTHGSITDVIRHRVLRWIGHVCCMQRDNIVRQANK